MKVTLENDHLTEITEKNMKVSLENNHLEEIVSSEGVTHIQVELKQPGSRPGTFREVKVTISLQADGGLLVNASDEVSIIPNFSNQFTFKVK